MSEVPTADVPTIDGATIDVEVIEQPAAVVAALGPMRTRMLRLLAEPGSATSVAKELGESRQRVNYHLRALEEHGLVRHVGNRPRRGLAERLVVASARSFVLSPAALGPVAASAATTSRLSARYLLAVAGRLITEVGQLAREADAAGQPLATLTIESDIKFASATTRAAFTAELADLVTDLTARYHDESSPSGRWHRLLVAAHPSPPPEIPQQSPAADPPSPPTDQPTEHTP